jgi:hypothetical protein
MNDLDPELQSLIEDARGAEVPPEGARERVRDNVLARVTTAAAGAAVTTAAATTAKAGASVATWMKLAAIGVVAIGAGVIVAERQPEPAPTAAVSTVSATAQQVASDAVDDAAPHAEAFPVAPAEEFPKREEDEASDTSPRATAAPVAASSLPVASASSEAETESPPDALAVELEVLRRARGLLNSGDGAGALAALDAYEREHLRGALGQERAVVRILALCQVGRVAEAKQAGALLIRLAPDSPTAKRLRNTCAAP